MTIQVASFVVVKASFAGAALNHYTCTNMLIYLRAIGVAVHIIFRFDGLAEHVLVGNVHCESLVETKRWCFLVTRNSYFGYRLKEFLIGCNTASESHTKLPRRMVLPVIKVFNLRAPLVDYSSGHSVMDMFPVITSSATPGVESIAPVIRKFASL